MKIGFKRSDELLIWRKKERKKERNIWDSGVFTPSELCLTLSNKHLFVAYQR